MKPIRSALILVAASLICVSSIFAATTTLTQARISPHDTISTVIAGDRVTIVYGRPFSKDPNSGAIRKIWGGLIPYDKVWRTGADEATLMITQQPIVMGGTTVPAGAYTLFTLPAADGTAKLIINKQIGQWGLQYDEKQDFARIDLVKDPPPAAQVDQFIMAIARDAATGGGVIKMTWENTEYSMPFTVQK
ncbi:MAG: DUF2911 domain-containing protein [Tepidisphaeraceae bacterium]|jgi:hypothetical protein